MPSHSTLFDLSCFDADASQNSFSILCDLDLSEPIGNPLLTSSPKVNSRAKTGQNKASKKPTPRRTLRCLTINFQSIKNKKADLLETIQSTKPDNIFSTETWLDPSIASSEYFPPGYNVYRGDKPGPDPSRTSYGGALLAISSDLISTKITKYQGENSVWGWAEINLVGAKKLILTSFYRAPDSGPESLSKYLNNIKKALKKPDTQLWASGDFNLPGLSWDENGHTMKTIPMDKKSREAHDLFASTIVDLNLTQMVHQPTRGSNTLDLFLTTYEDIVNRTETLPPLGKADHDIVFVEVTIRPLWSKKPPRKIFNYKKSNWDNMRKDLEDMTPHFDILPDDPEILWNKLKDTLTSSINKNIPSKMSRTNNKLPWVTTETRRLIRKRNSLYAKRKLTRS